MTVRSSRDAFPSHSSDSVTLLRRSSRWIAGQSGWDRTV
jgi:hypothetical protein